MSDSLLERVAATGLLPAERPVVVLVSGGRDSVCLLDVAVELGASVRALHVNYGLRDDAGEDEALCVELCARLGVELAVRRPKRPEGNLQAWARDVRYAEALRRGGVAATGHTATDQVETVLYRLAASPGRRALLGMPARSGRLVRPLLGITRTETAAYCEARGLTWREDPSNRSDAFARNRIRHGLLEAMRTVHPAAEANVLATLDVLRDEAAVLDAAVDAALAETDGAVEALRALPPALARLAVQRLADRAGDRSPAVGPRAQEILGLGAGGGSATLDVGGGVRAVVEYGRLRFERDRARPSAPSAAAAAQLAVPAPAGAPSAVTWAGGRVTIERAPDLPVDDDPHTATLDAAPLAAALEVRAWRPGDRMRPLGLDGSRSLQDLFTDRKLPRARRARTPVILSAGEIAWVPGVAAGERFRVSPSTRDRVRIAWLPPGP